MNSSSCEIAALQQRVADLERSSRRWKFGGVILAVALLAAAAPREQSSDSSKLATFESVKARRFTVVGQDGGIQAELLGGRGGYFGLYANGSQKPFSQVATTKDGFSSLVLQPPTGADGPRGMSVIVDDKTGGSAIFCGPNGKAVVSLNPEDRTKLGAMNVRDANGELLWKSP